MSDRELLEKAAMAAGFTSLGYGELSGGSPCLYLRDADFSGVWAPLTDDGDCARLEAACMLDVEWQTQHVIVGRTMLDKWQEPYLLHDGDKQAARRFAAVRAAAAQSAIPSLSQGGQS